MSDFFVRADGTYLIEGMQGDNPKLLGRELVDGRDSLYLEFYLGREVTTSRNGRSYTRALRRQVEKPRAIAPLRQSAIDP